MTKYFIASTVLLGLFIPSGKEPNPLTLNLQTNYSDSVRRIIESDRNLKAFTLKQMNKVDSLTTETTQLTSAIESQEATMEIVVTKLSSKINELKSTPKDTVYIRTGFFGKVKIDTI